MLFDTNSTNDTMIANSIPWTTPRKHVAMKATPNANKSVYPWRPKRTKVKTVLTSTKGTTAQTRMMFKTHSGNMDNTGEMANTTAKETKTDKRRDNCDAAFSFKALRLKPPATTKLPNKAPTIFDAPTATRSIDIETV
jgi:hypothetical protein